MFLANQKIKLYDFTELTEDIQTEVHQEFIRQYGNDYDFTEERKSLEEFGRLMDITFDYEFDYDYVSRARVKSNIESTNHENLYGVRLIAYIYNNYGKYFTEYKRYYKGNKKRISRITKEFDGCHLTGYYTDDTLTKTLEKYLKKPTAHQLRHYNYLDVMSDCLDAWIVDCRNEYKYRYSLDYMTDCLACWNVLFTEEGKWLFEIDQLQYDLEEIRFDIEHTKNGWYTCFIAGHGYLKADTLDGLKKLIRGIDV